VADGVRRMSLSSVKAASFWGNRLDHLDPSSVNFSGKCLRRYARHFHSPNADKSNRARGLRRDASGKAELAPGPSTGTLLKLHTYRNIPDNCPKTGKKNCAARLYFLNKTLNIQWLAICTVGVA
jgi:hypothetical protein